MIVHDLRCEQCGAVERNVAIEAGKYPRCECGGKRDWNPAQLNTDVYGSPQYSDASGRVHSSQHEKRKFMREAGFHEAGDLVGGARADHRIKNSAFMFPGKRSHTSVGEREAARRR